MIKKVEIGYVKAKTKEESCWSQHEWSESKGEQSESDGEQVKVKVSDVKVKANKVKVTEVKSKLIRSSQFADESKQWSSVRLSLNLKN